MSANCLLTFSNLSPWKSRDSHVFANQLSTNHMRISCREISSGDMISLIKQLHFNLLFAALGCVGKSYSDKLWNHRALCASRFSQHQALWSATQKMIKVFDNTGYSENFTPCDTISPVWVLLSTVIYIKCLHRYHRVTASRIKITPSPDTVTLVHSSSLHWVYRITHSLCSGNLCSDFAINEVLFTYFYNRYILTVAPMLLGSGAVPNILYFLRVSRFWLFCMV